MRVNTNKKAGKIERSVEFVVRSVKKINDDMDTCTVRLESGIELTPTGTCYNCTDSFSNTDKYRDFRLFCDNVCEDSWVEWTDSIKQEGNGAVACSGGA